MDWQGLSSASRDALARADVVFGGPRHLELAGVGGRGQAWPVPFDAAPVLALRGQAVVVLASGDPFWHGVGGTLAAHLAPGEWVCHPGPSTPSLVAARLGWRLEETVLLGLHAAPFARLIPHLHNGAQIIATLRDGAAPAELAAWLVGQGFGASTLHVLERVGGPHERVRQTRADAFDINDIAAPVTVAIRGEGLGLPRGFGLPDDAFAHDGQITKRPIRALTLSALGPRPGQHLWDIGAGSGSISVEWCLAGGTAQAVEGKASRAANIRANAGTYGVDHRLTVIEGTAPAALAGLTAPDAIFVGGGMDAALFATLQPLHGTRLVANAVTLETEALLTQLHAVHGGTLLRIDVATATPLGTHARLVCCPACGAVERDAMIAAGIGFRSAAPVASLQAALTLAMAQGGLTPQTLATAAAKATAPQITKLSRTLDLPLQGVDVAGMITPTQSLQSLQTYATGSVAEAAALIAAGPGARLIVRRVTSPDGMATAALAEGPDP